MDVLGLIKYFRVMRETNTKELLSVYFDRQWRPILEGEAVNVYNCIILCNLQIDRQWLAIYILALVRKIIPEKFL